jgi:hypothetical protein
MLLPTVDDLVANKMKWMLTQARLIKRQKKNMCLKAKPIQNACNLSILANDPDSFLSEGLLMLKCRLTRMFQ